MFKGNFGNFSYVCKEAYDSLRVNRNVRHFELVRHDCPNHVGRTQGNWRTGKSAFQTFAGGSTE